MLTDLDPKLPPGLNVVKDHGFAFHATDDASANVPDFQHTGSQGLMTGLEHVGAGQRQIALFTDVT
jgi:hypothetical protein